MPQGDAGVTLEITVAPTDLPHAVHVLPHQLRTWADQVDDVQFTLDLHTSRGRFGAAAEERRPAMERLLAELCERWPKAHVEVVDYSPATVAAVARRFFGRDEIPAKNHYGGPLYSYFYGPYAARHEHILHADSDMLFGGGSPTWCREAIELLAARPDVIACSPHPGPPRPDGGFAPHARALHVDPRPEEGPPGAWSFASFSTRVSFVHRGRLLERLAPFPLQRPRARSWARALVEGHPPYGLPEDIVTQRMQERGLRRLDFLGAGPGMWALHPPMRSDEFYRELPRLIERVEAGDVPDAQRGDHDVNDSLVDWSSARAALRRQVWWRRMPRSVAARLRG